MKRRANPTRSIRPRGHVSRARLFLDPYGKCIARPVRRSREAARKPDDPATALKRVVVDPEPLTGKGYPSWSARCEDHNLRDVCWRLHATSKLGCRAGQAWHLHRFDRKDSRSTEPWRQCPSSFFQSLHSTTRTIRRTSVITGDTTPVFRTALHIQLTIGPAPRDRLISRNDAAPSWDRGHPGRGAQSPQRAAEPVPIRFHRLGTTFRSPGHRASGGSAPGKRS